MVRPPRACTLRALLIGLSIWMLAVPAFDASAHGDASRAEANLGQTEILRLASLTAILEPAASPTPIDVVTATAQASVTPTPVASPTPSETSAIAASTPAPVEPSSAASAVASSTP